MACLFSFCFHFLFQRCVAVHARGQCHVNSFQVKWQQQKRKILWFCYQHFFISLRKSTNVEFHGLVIWRVFVVRKHGELGQNRMKFNRFSLSQTAVSDPSRGGKYCIFVHNAMSTMQIRRSRESTGFVPKLSSLLLDALNHVSVSFGSVFFGIRW